MYVDDQGIVLRIYPFKDNKTIGKIYTKESGLVSFIIKKTKTQIILSQPLTIANIIYKKTKANSLYYIKETSLNYMYQSVPYDVKKLNCCLVLCEILNKCAKESNPRLYSFITESLKWLDCQVLYPTGFDSLFLIKFCELIGISPFNVEGTNHDYVQLNLNEGIFIENTGIDKRGEGLVPTYESLELLKLASMKYANLHDYKITYELNEKLFNYLVLYISKHLVDIHNLKSIKILKEITA